MSDWGSNPLLAHNARIECGSLGALIADDGPRPLIDVNLQRAVVSTLESIHKGFVHSAEGQQIGELLGSRASRSSILRTELGSPFQRPESACAPPILLRLHNANSAGGGTVVFRMKLEEQTLGKYDFYRVTIRLHDVREHGLLRPLPDLQRADF